MRRRPQGSKATESLFPDRKVFRSQSLQEAVFRNGVELSLVVFYDPQSTDVSAEVQVLADFNQRRSAAEAQRRDLQGRSDEAAQRALQRLQGVETIGDLPFEDRKSTRLNSSH